MNSPTLEELQERWAEWTSDEIPDISSLASRLDLVLRSRPYIADDAEHRIVRRINSDIDERTWIQIRRDVADLDLEFLDVVLAWVLTQRPTPLGALSEVLDANALAAFLAHLVARYGDELRHAWARWGSPADEWDNLRRDVYFDVVQQRYYINLRIDKVSGEVMYLHGTASSVMSLVSGILRGLAEVGVADAFSAPSRSEFIDEALGVLDFLAPTESGDAGLDTSIPTSDSTPDPVQPDEESAGQSDPPSG